MAAAEAWRHCTKLRKLWKWLGRAICSSITTISSVDAGRLCVDPASTSSFWMLAAMPSLICHMQSTYHNSHKPADCDNFAIAVGQTSN